MENLFRLFFQKIASRFEHFFCICLNIFDTRKLRQRFRCSPVLICAGRRAERQGVGENCGTEDSRDVLFRLQAGFLVMKVYDRCSTAYRHHTDVERFCCLYIAELVMVENTEDFSIHDIIGSLCDFVVIYENYSFSRSIFEKFGRFDTEAAEYEFCFGIHRTSSFRDIGDICGIFCILKCGVAYRGADGICIRIFVTDDINGVVAQSVFLLSVAYVSF